MKILVAIRRFHCLNPHCLPRIFAERLTGVSHSFSRRTARLRDLQHYLGLALGGEAGFDFTFQPSLDRDRVLTLAQLGFVGRSEVVHFLGPPGTGKSHLAIALGVEAVKAGRSVYFTTLADLLGQLARAEREGRLGDRLRFFCRPSLLIVDEIGYLPVVPGGGNLFFQLVNARYERGAIILTSNRGFAEWGEVFGDPSSRLHCWTGCSTTPSSCKSKARVTGYASTQT